MDSAPRPLVDDEVLQQFVRGSEQAFETLFRRHQREVYAWIIRIVRDRAAAEDLTIETFWRTHRYRASFHPDRSFGAWLRRIATRVAFDHLRSRRMEVALPATSSVPPAADPAVQQETLTRIRTAFQGLPADLRLVATLALVEELPYQEIAEAVEIPVGTVKSRVFRAVRRLRKELTRMDVHP